MTTGERIKKARKTAGLTQQELGKKLGVSGSMIGQYETNLRKPKPDTLLKIATALKIHPHELYSEVAWLFENVDFSTNVSKAFGLLKSILDHEDSPPLIKRAIESELPDFDTIWAQLPALITNITDAAIFNNLANPNQSERTILALLRQLNAAGQAAAIERVVDLTEIPRYQQSSAPPDNK